MSKILYPSQKKYLQKLSREEDSLVLEMEKFASKKKDSYSISRISTIS